MIRCVLFALRDYQADLINRTRAALQRHRSVIVCAPTGSGKTALASYMIARAAERQKTAWFVCHRDFLLTQTAAAFDQVGVSYGFIAAGREFNPYQRVQIAAIDTLRRRLDRLTPPDFIVLDEAHHVAARTWSSVVDWAGKQCRIVGLSATPARLDGRGLDNHFGEIVNGPSVRWLMDAGYLSRYRCYAPSTPDLRGVKSRAGDYASGELAGVMDTGEIAGNIVGQYKSRAMGKRAIYYAVSIEHSTHVASAFTAAGIGACHVDGSSTPEERMVAASSLACGDIQVICNVELMGEGFDLSAQSGVDVPIECVGLCRPTQSLTLHLQQIGRALRPKSEPAIILDHAGNCMRHGLPDDEREWSLTGIDRKSRKADNGPPIRICEICYGCFGASTRICPYCQHQNGLTPREVEEIQADLVEADRELIRAAKQREVQRAQTLEDLIKIGAARGYKSGWAHHRWAARQARGQAIRPSRDLRADLLRSLDRSV